MAASGIEVPHDVPRLESDGVEVAVWAYPADPFLPGLASAADTSRAAELLRDLDVAVDSVRLRRRAYRAGRRAVIEVSGTSASIYLKVVRPARVALLQERHSTIAAHLPVPRSLGWSEPLGIVALQALPGRPLRNAIEAGSETLPNVRAIVELLDRLPALARQSAPGPLARVTEHVRLLGAIAPKLKPRLEAIAAAVSMAPPEPQAAVHGDFHASQILVDGAKITGLVDVDTAGTGLRPDDFAGLLAQLSTLALSSSQRRRFDQYGASLIADFDQIVDARGLRLRVAAAVLGFATGPFRVQLEHWRQETVARVGLAERWVESARSSG